MQAPQAITNPLRPGAVPQPAIYPQGNAAQSSQAPQVYSQGDQSQGAQAAPAASPAAAAPIPEPYVYLVQCFDACLAACTSHNNPTYKKKLDDVARRLEALKDRLRAGDVDMTVAQQLHYMAAYVQNSDYNSALQIHQQCVASSNPDMTAVYLTGLKTLFTLAKSLAT